MRIEEIVKLLPTQFKRVSENPLYVGHRVPLLGYWKQSTGFVKKLSLEYKEETLACPIIAVVDEKIGAKDLVLTITGKVSEYNTTTEEVSGDYTLKRKIYKDSGEIVEAELTIPRFTRAFATFLITGLGQNIFEITNVTTTVTNIIGKVSFYALASAGSKILYWFGIHNLAEEVREIVRPWIAPPKCERCSGTGIEPDTEDDCKDCKGYKYSGYSATKYVQRKIGADLGLAREVLDYDNLTDADHDIIKKFINVCWTQKWWITPTKKEIKRIFAHFYSIPEAAVKIEERFNLQEPVWSIYLPRSTSLKSPFGRLTVSDLELMKDMAESLTPAGVSVFVGFMDIYKFGNLGTFDQKLLTMDLSANSVMNQQNELWNVPRWDLWNGWCECTHNFEDESIDDWSVNGDVEIVNPNNINRHMVKFTDSSYIKKTMEENTGYIELWVHPENSILTIGVQDLTPKWLFYIYFDTDGFYDNNDVLLTKAVPDVDYHISIEFNNIEEKFKFEIQQELTIEDISYLNSGSSANFKIENDGIGDAFIDNIGLSNDINYEKGKNFRRLYPNGYGSLNEMYPTGATGTVYDVYELNARNLFFELSGENNG